MRYRRASSAPEPRQPQGKVGGGEAGWGGGCAEGARTLRAAAGLSQPRGAAPPGPAFLRQSPSATPPLTVGRGTSSGDPNLPVPCLSPATDLSGTVPTRFPPPSPSLPPTYGRPLATSASGGRQGASTGRASREKERAGPTPFGLAVTVGGSPAEGRGAGRGGAKRRGRWRGRGHGSNNGTTVAWVGRAVRAS